MRAHNTALLLREIWKDEGVSRADLARRFGLSRATVSDIVGSFVELGVVTESQIAPAGGGRPPLRLQFQDGWRHVIGVELGASHVSGVRADLRGRVLARFDAAPDVDGDPTGTLAQVDAGIRQLLSSDLDTPVIGLGVGVPSPVRRSEGGRLATRLFPRWAGVDVAAHLRATHGLPVLLDNDANLGALAEHWWGAGQGLADLAYIKLGTGVGAGILINGAIHRGATGIAGEIGHTTIDPDGPPCRCGLQGCLEAYVGAASLLARAAAVADTAPRIGNAAPHATVQALISRAQSGDPVAAELVRSAGTWLGIAIANLLNLVNPARVILGGSLADAGPLLLEPLTQALERRALWTSVAGADVCVSALGDDAVSLGAATLVIEGALSAPAPLLHPPGHAPGPSQPVATPAPLPT
jgi:glucokinase-like ROK family protein